MSPPEDNAASGDGGLPRTITFGGDNTGQGQIHTLRTFPSRDPHTAQQAQAGAQEKAAPDQSGNAGLESGAKGKEEKAKAKNVDITEHMLSLEEICAKFSVKVNPDRPQESYGLGSAQAADLLAANGPNALTPPKKKSSFHKFLLCLSSLFNLMLIAAGILEYILLAIDYKDNKANIYMGAILIAVAFINAGVEWWQQRKSENTLAALLKMIPAKTHVIRDAKLDSIQAAELVVGDVVFLRIGDKIPADCYVFSSSDLKVDNSSLTGESEPQERTPGNTMKNPLEATNMVFNGTLVVSGEAYTVVVRTGDNTVLGQIAGMTAGEEKAESPLNHEIALFVRIIATVAIFTAAIFFVAGMCLYKDFPFAINFAIGTFVAWVPEGLPATVTMLLTIAAKRMAAENVLVKDLQGVETLGAITLLATDKTGTLTRNQMTVTNIWANGRLYSATRGHSDMGEPITDAGVSGVREIIAISTLCRSVKFDRTDVPMDKRQLLGDATESGLVRFAGARIGDEFDEMLPSHPKVFEVPFNSANKWMLSVHKLAHDTGALTLLIKGAPERILRLCTTILYQGKVVPLTDAHTKQYDETYEFMASRGHRVLAFAQLQLDGSEYPEDYVFSKKTENYPKAGYTFVGLSSLEDPPKHGVREAIGRCRSAGIQVMMVTGDHPLTAEAIGRKINLVIGETREGVAHRTGRPVEDIGEDEYDAMVIHGEKIADMTERDWELVFRKPEVIFARTSPKNKLEIVTQAQSIGHICGVTGDGVNDSPALKKADLGIAMNESGSDVSKEAASMILLDDNFASIVKGIEEGRLIFANLKKSIRYTVSHSTPEVIPQILYIIVPLPPMLTSIMILCIDLGFEIMAALTYAWEPAESKNGLMKLPPRKPVTMRSIAQLRAYNARHPPPPIDPETGKPAKYKWHVRLAQAIKAPFGRVWWQDRLEKKDGEILVDGDLLSWAYLEAGLISTISLVLTFFVILNKHHISPRQARLMAKDTSKTYFNKDSPDYTYNGRTFTGTDQFYALNEARTGLLFSIYILQVFNLFICKARFRLPFGKFMFRNTRTFYGFGGGLVLLAIVTYIPPLNSVFNSSYKSIPLYWLIAVGFGFFLLAYATGRMLFLRKSRPIKWNNTIEGLHMHPTIWSTRHTTKSIDLDV
ncbi:hypothetical protein IW140_004656 [Coemansia sp. RSA 1813]|nr:hypothetical protein EV178_004709 [Coemansia sp. RSA 1646]KAJ1767632.1 hypothetical protein LPJ74_005267 [Coemansia sp. RSA 1843]KAJ2087622.1 hypothetical protein IW138_004825 [Coemansia sp. RSA 986]KAJ2214367.1 hypothetical protein EV179_003032 [Coemansia sp. RSA 487]KAJ2567089.1 hypothetical protein IW140_004656 [Coemansia sp. RSA 1813]